MTDALLRIEGAHLRLGERDVLAGASLELRAGEIVLLAGRNGAGKTTLLRVAAGLLAPDRGSVMLGGGEIAQLRRREIAQQLALVPQDTAVPFPYTAAELVLMGRTPHLGWLGFERPSDRELVAALLERLGIGEFADRSVLTLSGGERQLVAIARALVQEARILLLDEPTAHLDLARRLDLERLLRSLAEDGHAIALVSHDLGPAAAVADRIALLADGRILANGPAADVLTAANLETAFGLDPATARAATLL